MRRLLRRDTGAAPRVAELALALVVYLILALVWLAPLVRHLDAAVLYGATDSVGALQDYWATEELGVGPLSFEHNPYNGAPEGYPRSTALAAANALQPLAFFALDGIAGDVAAWNMLTIAGFVLSALGMFALLRYLRLGRAASFLGGYAFGFGPWMFGRAYEGHAGMQHLWVLPLLFLACLHVRRTASVRSAAVTGALVALAMYLHSYIGLMAGVIAVTFLGLELIVTPARLRTLALAGVAVLTALAVFAPPLYLHLTAPSEVQRSVGQPLSDVQTGGATLLDYILPSDLHPLFGSIRPDHLGGEHVAFWGYVVIVGAIAGALALLRRPGFLEREHGYATLFATAVVLVAFVVSLKPVFRAGGVTIYTPSYAIWEVVPFWRAYARVGVVVGLALIVLAAFAFEALRRRRNGAWLAAAAAAILVFELAVSAPVPIWRTDAMPAHVQWLRDHPGGIVAHYPLPIEEPALSLGAEENWNVVKHRHPLFALWGGNNGGSWEEAIRIVASDISQPLAGPVLAAEQVEYAVVHDRVYAEIGAAPPTVDLEQFELLADFDGVRIFGVTAAPADLDEVLAEQAERIALARAYPAAEVAFGGGFNAPEAFEDGREWRWMLQGGELELIPALPGRYLITFDAFANGQPRTLELRRDGTVLGSVRVETSRLGFRVGPLQLDGRTAVTLAADPGPQPLDASRQASIFLSPVTLLPAPDFYGRLNPG